MSSLEEIIGQTQYLKDISQLDSRTENIDISAILYTNKKSQSPHFCTTKSNDPWDRAALNKQIMHDLKDPIIQKINLALLIRLLIAIDLWELKPQALLHQITVRKE